jgi:acetyl coenzyme A synthetase (ADP forming)-like protein
MMAAVGEKPVAVSAWAHYATDALLRDGTSIRIRAIGPDDKASLLDHFRRLSPESVHFRFFIFKKTLSEAELAYFTEIDFVDHAALAATLREGGEERFIGVARYIRSGRGGRREGAEAAFAVEDAHQGLGIGTLLLEHLARIASANGITRFEADVLPENRRMLEVFERSGFRVQETLGTGVVHAWFPIEETEEALEASDRRFTRAAAASVRGLFHPRSVAVIGASRDPRSIGAALVANLKRDGFTGTIYPVNPHARTIEGLPCFPSVSAIGKPIDLGIVAVPAAAVEAVVRECAAAGAKGVVVISAGYAEVSPEGREAQRRLRELVRGSGMRMIGPNCMGIMNTDPAVSLNGTFAPVFPLPGNIGMLSQSGALGVAILDYSRALRLGLSSFASVGNKADVSGNDLLAYWKDDPRTGVIALYLESFGNPRRFARLAPEVARKKPIVAVKSGRSAPGTRAASSHSAALACLDVAVDALFEQAGVIRTETLEDLFDVVSLLSTQPVPPGPRVGIVTNAGGPGILLADACDARGLSLPELRPETLRSLRAFLPAEAGLRNPVDMIASATPDHFAQAIAAVGQDADVDSLVVVYVPPVVTRPEEVAAAIARGAAEVPPSKPVLTVFLSSKGAPDVLASGARGRLPSYSFPENAARALAAAERYGRWRARPRGQRLSLDPPARAAIREVIERAISGRDEPVWLEVDDVETVLRAAGIAPAESRRVRVDEAEAAAEVMGYPLVAKAVAPGLVHKSDVGGVVLGLGSAAAVRDAIASMTARLRESGHALQGVVLQREVRGGIEALVGVVNDSLFGPLVVCGLGGVQVELLRDAAFRLPPVTDANAEAMLDKLRLKALLDGYRGSPPGDRAALVSVIQRVSALVEAVPELRELDLNPVKVLAPGEGAVVVDARIRIGRPA